MLLLLAVLEHQAMAAAARGRIQDAVRELSALHDELDGVVERRGERSPTVPLSRSGTQEPQSAADSLPDSRPSASAVKTGTRPR